MEVGRVLEQLKGEVTVACTGQELTRWREVVTPMMNFNRMKR